LRFHPEVAHAIYVGVAGFKLDDSLSIRFYNSNDKPLALGSNLICEMSNSRCVYCQALTSKTEADHNNVHNRLIVLPDMSDVQWVLHNCLPCRNSVLIQVAKIHTVPSEASIKELLLGEESLEIRIPDPGPADERSASFLR
jgi:hypothetical protein